MSRFLDPRHDGHEEKAQGYYTANNDLVKYGFWVIIVLVLSLWLTTRALKFLLQKRHVQEYTKVDTGFEESSGPQATGVVARPSSRPVTTLGRAHSTFCKIRHQRIAFPGRWLQYCNPPSLGQSLFLGLYWVVILAGLWTNVIFRSSSTVYEIQWEVVGFRAAWVSTTQLPLLYATGCRINVISLVTGITHERLNWFHRWIARTVFMTLIVHWAFFYREWDITGFVRQEIESMPMVLWGFAAWGAIGLMVLSGFGWFRDRFFEVWLLSHILLAWAVLALSYTHTRCTTYFVGASLGMLLIDLIGRALLMLLNNTHWQGSLANIKRFGHTATLEQLHNDYLRLTLDDCRFRWRAGQHVYVTVPKIRLFQSHPFTIVGAGVDTDESSDQSMSLIIKAHSGFTRGLHRTTSIIAPSHVRVLLHGPYGNPPAIYHKDVIIFIATGNRASFTMSLLASVARQGGRRPDVSFHWIVPDIQMVAWYKGELQTCMSDYAASDARLDVYIHVTQSKFGRTQMISPMSETAGDDLFSVGRHSDESDDSSRSLTEGNLVDDTQAPLTRLKNLPAPKSAAASLASELEKETTDESETALLSKEEPQSYEDSDKMSEMLRSNLETKHHIAVRHSRPTADALIQPALEEASPRQSIMVIAAVPPMLAADVAREVSRLVGTRESGHLSRQNVELWIEENGS